MRADEGGGSLKVDLAERRMSCDNASLPLKATPCRLLSLLLEHMGQIVSRRTIYKEIWGYDFDPGTKVLEVQVHYLRGALQTLPTSMEIKTYRGKGLSLQERSGPA